MIRRKKSTFFLDAKENTTVQELKRMIEGITKKPPGEQRLFNKEDAVMTSFFYAYSLSGHFDSKYSTFSLFFLRIQQFWIDLEMRLKSRLEKPEKFVKVDFHSLFTKCSDAAHFPENFSNQFLILKTSNYQQKKIT